MKQVCISIILIIFFSSCSKEFNSPQNSSTDIFNSFWKYTDENYIFFDYKNIDWVAKKNLYQNKINENMSEDSLFSVCSTMLDELKDGHCSLSNEKATHKYDYTKGYNVHFDLNVVKSKYLKNNFQINGSYTYGIINDSIGYIYYESFNQGNKFEGILKDFIGKNIKKLIIDIRNNSGGEPSIAQNMVGYFVNTETLIGFIQHKNGKRYSDLTNKISLKAYPKTIFFPNKVNVIINRKSYSAASYFAGMINYIPKVQLIGQVTGGGGGAALSYELPNGWTVAITSNFYLDNKNNHIENGVLPTIEIINSKSDIENQLDKMLQTAIEK